MKIGFSLGRCVRDIVNGDIGLDEVAFIITATSISSVEQLVLFKLICMSRIICWATIDRNA